MESNPVQLDYAGTGGSSGRYEVQRQRTLIAELFTVAWSAFLWTGAFFFLLAGAIGWILFLSGPVIGFPALVVVVILVPMIATAARRVRRRRATAVLGYLRQAVRLNLPLNRVLAAAAVSEQGRLTRQITDLRLELEAGSRLSVALDWTVPEMPQRSIGLIGFAEQSGQLTATLNRLVDEESRIGQTASENRAFAAWYPPVLLMIVAGCIAFLGVFIYPRYAEIFAGFHVSLPAITRWIIDCMDLVVPIAPVLAVLILIMSGIRLRDAVRLRRPSWIFRPIKDRIVWWLPIIGTLRRDSALADVCSVVADSIEGGHSLEAALTRAEQLQMNVMFERRIQRWSQGLHVGMPARDAARAAGMPPLLVGLLANGQSTATFGEVFRFAARFYTDRHAARRAVLSGLVVPVITVVMGVIVGLIALSIFLPLCRLVDAAGPHAGL